MELHVRFAESENFRNLLDREVVRKVLSVYPDLPPQLGRHGMMFGSRLLSEQEFLDTLSCPVFRRSVMNATFVNTLQPFVLKVKFECSTFGLVQ